MTGVMTVDLTKRDVDGLDFDERLENSNNAAGLVSRFAVISSDCTFKFTVFQLTLQIFH